MPRVATTSTDLVSSSLASGLVARRVLVSKTPSADLRNARIHSLTGRAFPEVNGLRASAIAVLSQKSHACFFCFSFAPPPPPPRSLSLSFVSPSSSFLHLPPPALFVRIIFILFLFLFSSSWHMFGWTRGVAGLHGHQKIVVCTGNKLAQFNELRVLIWTALCAILPRSFWLD